MVTSTLKSGAFSYNEEQYNALTNLTLRDVWSLNDDLLKLSIANHSISSKYKIDVTRHSQ